jgi:hypothetical protein
MNRVIRNSFILSAVAIVVLLAGPRATVSAAQQSASAKKTSSGGPNATSDTFAKNDPAPTSASISDASSKSSASAPATTASTAHETSSKATPAANSDDNPAPQPENDSANPACQDFFSAYGLAPSQLKWIAQNRKKLFASICPAPDITKVGYVMIFTHDVDFFNVTMPTPVHKIEGFSDFRALTPTDTGLTSASDPDKARHQYVWIFRVAPGTFDPDNFSPRRRYQFSTVESSPLGSKASLKAVEDAFRFVATASH